jgi:xanthosine utilization system XapX-like protein
MKPLSIAGLVLLIVGLVGLAVGHLSFTTEKKVIDLGPIQATTQEQHSIPIPDIAGVAAVAAGLILMVVGQRRS